MGQLTKRLAPLQFPARTKIYDRRKISPTIFLKRGAGYCVLYKSLRPNRAIVELLFHLVITSAAAASNKTVLLPPPPQPFK
jgi:hypothetical protein